MFTVKIAGVSIGIDNKYGYVEALCKEYISYQPCELTVSVTEAEIAAEKVGEYEKCPDDGVVEALAIYRKIALALLDYNAYVFHAAVIEVDGNAYAFTAKSGVGKSTHIALWKKVYGDRVKIINGDKPVIRIEDNRPYAYGTPWAGKEGWQRNARAPLKAICFIERGKENTVDEIGVEAAAPRFLEQVLCPESPEKMLKTAELAIKTLKSVSIYSMKCDISENAAKAAFSKMTSH